MENVDINELALEIVKAVDSYIIYEYGINPILGFTDEEDGAHDIVVNILKNKLK